MRIRFENIRYKDNNFTLNTNILYDGILLGFLLCVVVKCSDVVEDALPLGALMISVDTEMIME